MEISPHAVPATKTPPSVAAASAWIRTPESRAARCCRSPFTRARGTTSMYRRSALRVAPPPLARAAQRGSDLSHATSSRARTPLPSFDYIGGRSRTMFQIPDQRDCPAPVHGGGGLPPERYTLEPESALPSFG